jgi:hypothetical protein
MRWPMKDARLWETRLWDVFYEKHAYEMACEMAYERGTHTRYTPVRGTPVRWPMGEAYL